MITGVVCIISLGMLWRVQEKFLKPLIAAIIVELLSITYTFGLSELHLRGMLPSNDPSYYGYLVGIPNLIFNVIVGLLFLYFLYRMKGYLEKVNV